MTTFLLCSECFKDEGLRLYAERVGVVADEIGCRSCGSRTGCKLDAARIEHLAHRFFVWGTLKRFDFGAAPLVQFNDRRDTDIGGPPTLERDMRLIEKAIGVGFFHYGPRFWMFGENEPLKAMQAPTTRPGVVERVLAEYPSISWGKGTKFYRIRKGLSVPEDESQYDSPPPQLAGTGRLDLPGFPVMYTSPDLSLCVHECRFTAEDELHVATLRPLHELKLLDLTEVLEEETNEFESLDMAVHMLFLAAGHSYEMSRDIALAAHSAGYDGLVYPSYFSLLRTGFMPFETAYGISLRRFPSQTEREKAKSVPNIAIFGRPVAENKIRVECINKLILSRVEYDFHFGPVGVH